MQGKKWNGKFLMNFHVSLVPQRRAKPKWGDLELFENEAIKKLDGVGVIEWATVTVDCSIAHKLNFGFGAVKGIKLSLKIKN